MWMSKAKKQMKIQQWFQEYSPAMVLYARSVVGDLQSAEDIVQEVFIALMKTSTLPEKPKNYLLFAVRNRSINFIQRCKIKVVSSSLEKYSFFSNPAENQEEREKLSQALMELPQEQREVIILKIWGNMTFQEIAKMLSCSLSTISSRYRYATQKLHETMKEYYYEQ